MSTFRNDTGGDLYLEGPDSSPMGVPVSQGGWDVPSTTVIKAGATVNLSNYYKRYTVAGGAEAGYALTLVTDDGSTYSPGVPGTPLSQLLSARWEVLETATAYADNLKNLNTLLGGSDARYLAIENEDGSESITVIINPNSDFSTGTEYTIAGGATLTLERDTILVSSISFAKGAGSGGGNTFVKVLYGN